MNSKKISHIIDIFKKNLRLGFSLAFAQFKVRNEGSYLGVLWYLLEPLCFFAIILLIGGVINQKPVQYYPLYVFLGLIMFNFFTNSTLSATKVIVSNAGLIKSMNVSRESLVMSGIFQFVFSHFIEMIIFLGFMVYFKGSILAFFWYFPIFFFFILFVSGISFMLATAGVYANDLSNIWSVFCRLLWFMTPLFYVMPSGPLLEKISYLNPMFHFINISREIIIYNRMPGFFAMSAMVFFSVLFLLAGLFIFRRYKSRFAELV